MSSNGVSTSPTIQRRNPLARWAVRLLISFLLLIPVVIIALAFFAARVISH